MLIPVAQLARNTDTDNRHTCSYNSHYSYKLTNATNNTPTVHNCNYSELIKSELNQSVKWKSYKE